MPVDATVIQNAAATTYPALIIYIVYVVICVALFSFLIRAILKRYSLKVNAAIILLILSSNIFIFEVLERGNSVLIVTVLLLAAIYLKDSQKPSYREIALILIAVAAGFKIYPALFGVLYIHERRIKEGVRLLIYGILLFFVPFVFFGGWSGMINFFTNQVQVQSLEYASIYCVKSTVRHFASVFTGDVFAYDTLATVLQIIFIAINIIPVFMKRVFSWERVLLLCAIIAFGPAWSGGYTSIFFVIPMVMFFSKSYNTFMMLSSRIKDNFIALCFAMTFCLNMFVLPSGFVVETLSSVPMYAIDFIVIGSIIYRTVSKKSGTVVDI